MYGDEIKAMLFLEERAWIVGLDPFPRLQKRAKHDDEDFLSCPIAGRIAGED